MSVRSSAPPAKSLDKKEVTIHIRFKKVDCLLAKQSFCESNYLTIQIAPEQSFFLSLNAKKRGVLSQIQLPLHLYR